MEQTANLYGKMYGKLRLFCYRYFFGGFHRRHRDITASEAMSADVVHLMGSPTVSEFAEFVGISQPNATYKIKNLVKKGYLKKRTSRSDRRVCRLEVGEKYEQMEEKRRESFLRKMTEKLGKRFTPKEMEIAGRVLDTAYEIMEEEQML